MIVKKCDHFEDLIWCLSLYTKRLVFNRTKKTHCRRRTVNFNCWFWDTPNWVGNWLVG